MADKDIFNIRGLNPSTDVPAYGGSGIAASTYAKENPDCSQATILSADDWNFLIDNIRRLIVGCGIDISVAEVVNDPALVLKAVQQCVANGASNVGAQAFSDTYAVPENTMTELNILANDTTDNRSQLSVTKINDTAVASGDTVAVANGSLRIRTDGLVEFTPTTDFTGVTGFIYEATDLSGVVSAAVVNLSVFDVPADIVQPPTLDIIEMRYASVTWAPPAWSQMTPLSAAQLAAIKDGNTVNRALNITGNGGTSWLAFELNEPKVLKKIITHPAVNWRTGQFRNVGIYYNNMLASDDGEFFSSIKSSVNTTNVTSPITNVVDINHGGGGRVFDGGTNPTAEWRTLIDAGVQRTRYMKAFNFADRVESADISNVEIVVA